MPKNECQVCGGDWVGGSYDHVKCFMKLMESEDKRRELAQVLDDVMSTGHCRAANNGERLMIFSAAVQYAKKLLRILRRQPESSVTV